MTDPDAPMGPGEFAWRIAWIAVRLVAAVWLAQRGAYFVYQGF